MNRLRLAAAFFAVYVFWGSGFLGVRVMVRDIPPLLGTGSRFVISGLVLLGWSMWRARRGDGNRRDAVRLSRRELAAVFVVGMLLIGGGNGLLAIGEQHVDSSLAALLAASIPLWIIVFRAIAREHNPPLGIVGTIVGLFGVGLLFLPGHASTGTSILASILLVVSAIGWAFGSWLVPRLPLPDSALVLTGWQMVLGGFGVVILGLLAGEAGDLRAPSSGPAAAYVYLTLVTGLIGYLAFVWLLQNVPIGKASTYAYVNPVVAVLLGWLILGEQPTTTMLIAATVIVASVAVTLRVEVEEIADRPALQSD